MALSSELLGCAGFVHSCSLEDAGARHECLPEAVAANGMNGWNCRPLTVSTAALKEVTRDPSARSNTVTLPSCPPAMPAGSIVCRLRPCTCRLHRCSDLRHKKAMHHRSPCRPQGPCAGCWQHAIRHLDPTCGQVPPHRLDGELDALVGALAAALQAVQRLRGAAHVPAQDVRVSSSPSVQKIAVRGEVHLQHWLLSRLQSAGDEASTDAMVSNACMMRDCTAAKWVKTRLIASLCRELLSQCNQQHQHSAARLTGSAPTWVMPPLWPLRTNSISWVPSSKRAAQPE